MRSPDLLYEMKKAKVKDYVTHQLQLSEPLLSDTGWLYLIIHPHHKAYVKIGKTSNPPTRLRAYNSMSPFREFSYFFLSEKLYDLAKLESVLGEVCRMVNMNREKREWYKYKADTNTSKANYLAERRLKFLVEIIESFYLTNFDI